MKRNVYTAIAVLMCVVSACNSGSTFSRATGLAYEVVVVADRALWESNTGEAIKAELTSAVPYLPQEEPSMRLTYCSPDQFDGLLKYVRNILIVSVNPNMFTKASLTRENDKWAKGQAVLYLNTPEAALIDTFLATTPRVIVDYFNREEMKRMREYLAGTHSPVVEEKAREKFGITLYAPTDIKSYKEGDDCLWLSNDAPAGRCDLLIYSFPFTDKNTFTLDYLVDKRDSVTKYLVPGAFPNSYMTTEKRVVDYFPSTLHNKYCGIVRGLWRMVGDMMGGPFVSYARVDEANNRVIVTEAFVYEPQSDKRKYIRRMEAALQTTLFANEQRTAADAQNTENQ